MHTEHDLKHIDLLACATALRAERRMRQQLFGAELFAEPIWDILLDLFIAECRGVSLLPTTLGGRGALARETNQRCLTALEYNGYVQLRPASGARRRGSLRLTEAGRLAIQRHLSAVVAQQERLKQHAAIAA
jgi:DNA-binding MarR family transcriptional regulator